MYWYVIPIFSKITESGGTGYVPGVSDPVVEFPADFNFTVHAASPKGAPTSALLGVQVELPIVPAGWTAKTLAEAQAHFEAVTGRAPTALEVF